MLCLLRPLPCLELRTARAAYFGRRCALEHDDSQQEGQDEQRRNYGNVLPLVSSTLFAGTASGMHEGGRLKSIDRRLKSLENNARSQGISFRDQIMETELPVPSLRLYTLCQGSL